MAALTIFDIARTGDSKAYVAGGTGGDTVPGNDGQVFVHVKNSNAATRDVIVDSVRPCDQGFDHNITVTVAATTGDEMIGPFPVQRFGSTLTITYTPDPPAGLTIAAIRLPA